MSAQQKQTDEILDFTDGMSAEKAKDAKKTAQRLLAALSPQRGKLFSVLIFVILGCVLTMAAPLIIGAAINEIVEGIQGAAAGIPFSMSLKAMGGFLAALVSVYLLSGLFSYLQQYIMASVAQTLTFSLRGRLLQKMARLPLSYFDRHKKGELLSRATNDLEKVADTLQEGLMQFLTSVVTLFGAVVLMFYISWKLTLIALFFMAVSILLTGWVSGKSHGYYMENQRTLGELNGRIEELFTGHTVIKAFNKEEESVEAVREVSRRLCRASHNAQFISYAVTPAVRLVNQIGFVLIAVIGGFFVAGGRLSLGLVQAFFQYVNQASEPLTEAAYILNKIQEAVASAERVFEVLDEEEETAGQEEMEKLPAARERLGSRFEVKGKVEFDRVKFGYDPSSPLMDGVSFTAKPGSKTAIVGPTGAGKTTLVNILMRFYDIQGGAVRVDGTDVTSISREELRSLFGMVLQDTWLFEGTIGENIGYGKVGATEEEIRAAAKTADADHFIRTLPGGYHTILKEDASNISQGQRQLLAIARAILADPVILILDEATSSVDTRTEKEIQKAMDVLMRGRTSFVIAHRLSTILDADQILVMDHGAIVERGSHQSLLEKNGVYAELYHSQFAGGKNQG